MRVQAAAIRAMHASGMKPAHIARQLGGARSSVYRMLPALPIRAVGKLPHGSHIGLHHQSRPLMSEPASVPLLGQLSHSLVGRRRRHAPG
jgi:hypothetical protein